jgi:hypothetical protein
MDRPLNQVAECIRSKNAGPFRITLDIVFRTHEEYQRVKASQVITPELVAALYRVPLSHVTDFVEFDPGKAIKITLRRRAPSGSVGDTDIYGAQQHAPLLGIRVP